MLPMQSEQKTMGTREIAQLVNSKHDSVLKTVRSLASEGFVSPTETHYTHEQNGQQYVEYLLDYSDTMMVTSGYSRPMRRAIIDRWQDLENSAPALPDFSNPVEAARAWADAKEAEQKALEQMEEAKPKVQVYEMLADRRCDVSTTVVAKEIGTTAIKLNRFLREQGCKMLRIDAPKAGYESWFNVVADVKNGHEFTQCLVTPEGQIEIAKLWGAQ